MVLWVFSSVVLIMLSLLRIAFITLLERKVLSLSQTRLGPNKLRIWGLLQPIIDGIKLILKKNTLVLFKQSLVFRGPILLFIIMIIIWLIIPWFMLFFSVKFSLLVFFCIIGVLSYGVMLVGWSSISVFSKLGSVRGILQTLSLEISLVIFFFSSFSFNSRLRVWIEKYWNITIVIWSMLLIILALIDCNRAPIDLLEGESELIRGFNLELGSILFVFIFLREYGIIIIFSFFRNLGFFYKLEFMNFMLFSFVFLFLRRCFPRIRYEQMIFFAWQEFLFFRILLFILLNIR